MIYKSATRTEVEWQNQTITNNKQKTTNSVALSPRANYTDWSTATCWRNLVSTFADRGVSRGQRGGSPTVVNLSFLDRDNNKHSINLKCVVCWDVSPRGSCKNRRFGRAYRLHLHMRPHPRSGLFPSGFPTNIPYAYIFSPFALHAQPTSSPLTSSF
jgi:hypothetical protein